MNFKWCNCRGQQPYSWYNGSRVCDKCDGFLDAVKEVDPWGANKR